jgi:hypothetical protein
MEQLSTISIPDASHRYWHSVMFSKLSNISITIWKILQNANIDGWHRVEIYGLTVPWYNPVIRRD